MFGNSSKIKTNQYRAQLTKLGQFWNDRFEKKNNFHLCTVYIYGPCDSYSPRPKYRICQSLHTLRCLGQNGKYVSTFMYLIVAWSLLTMHMLFWTYARRIDTISPTAAYMTLHDSQDREICHQQHRMMSFMILRCE